MNLVVQKGNFDPQHIKKKYITKEIYLLYPQVEEQSPDIRSVYLPAQCLKIQKTLYFLHLLSDCHGPGSFLFWILLLTPKETSQPAA